MNKNTFFNKIDRAVNRVLRRMNAECSGAIVRICVAFVLMNYHERQHDLANLFAAICRLRDSVRDVARSLKLACPIRA